MASALPEDVWSLILQHVPVADRLQHCALVCKKLSQAAAAATDALKVSLQHRRQEQQQQLAEAVASYLQHYGSHVTRLVLYNYNQPLLQLPCARLLHLDISSAGAVQLGHVAALTSLHKLSLQLLLGDEDAGAAAAHGAAALLPLTALRQLDRCDIDLGAQLGHGDDQPDKVFSCYAVNEADPGQPPDVWLQVLEQCLEGSGCQPAVTAVTKQLAGRLEQQEQRLAQQEQQNGQLQQRVAEHEQQNAELQQRLGQQEQHNGELQAQVAEQAQQISQLQAQVQQLAQQLARPQR